MNKQESLSLRPMCRSQAVELIAEASHLSTLLKHAVHVGVLLAEPGLGEKPTAVGPVTQEAAQGLSPVLTELD